MGRMGFSPLGLEWGDLQLAGEPVQTRAQRLRYRHAEPGALGELGAALFSGQQDALDAVHAPRAAQLARELVDPALELGDLAEAGDREGDEGGPGVGGRGVVGVEVYGLAPHRAAVERAGEQAEHQRET